MWLVVQNLGILLSQTGHWIRRLDCKPGPDGHFAQLRGHWAKSTSIFHSMIIRPTSS
jgi:hypothetical protein